MTIGLVVAAGGSSSRFHKSASKSRAKLPESKLYLPLGGKPVLVRSLEVFENLSEISRAVVTVPKGQETFVRSLFKKHGLKKPEVVRGGDTRAQSVQNGMKALGKSADWIMVHDGARPLVTSDSVRKLFAESFGTDGVLLAKKVVPTLKEAREDRVVVKTVDRTKLFEAETPQMIRREILEKAYKLPESSLATDEASLAESVNAKLKLVVHDTWNPKITTVQDYDLAQKFWEANIITTRTGFGRDIHKLVPGRKMILGGVRIPFDKGPLGHSDGDALLHAITDAVLGTMGAGDIGDWFSDKDPKHKNIASTKILKAVMDEAAKKGFTPLHVDTVIVLERPKLGSYKQEMKKTIAKLLNLPLENVSIKAKTAEGFGPEGQGLAVSCEAVVTVRKSV